jgi:hypothetical protein
VTSLQTAWIRGLFPSCADGSFLLWRGALSNGRPYRARQIGGQADRGGMAPEVPPVRLRRSHTASRARIRPSSIIVFAQRPFQEDRS